MPEIGRNQGKLLIEVFDLLRQQIYPSTYLESIKLYEKAIASAGKKPFDITINESIKLFHFRLPWMKTFSQKKFTKIGSSGDYGLRHHVLPKYLRERTGLQSRELELLNEGVLVERFLSPGGTLQHFSVLQIDAGSSSLSFCSEQRMRRGNFQVQGLVEFNITPCPTYLPNRIFMGDTPTFEVLQNEFGITLNPYLLYLL